MDKLHPDLRCVALVHTMEYHEGAGSREKFAAANRKLRANGHRVAKAKYTWYNPMRYWIMWESSKFDNLCQAFGWSAYQEVCRKGMNGGGGRNREGQPHSGIVQNVNWWYSC